MPQPEDLHNGLERGVLEQYPEVARAKADLLRAGASLARLSGSGPTLYAKDKLPYDAEKDFTPITGLVHESNYLKASARPAGQQ